MRSRMRVLVRGGVDLRSFRVVAAVATTDVLPASVRPDLLTSLADLNGSGTGIHVAVALEHHALIHREAGRRDVCLHAGMPLELDGVARFDLPGDLSSDDHRAAADVRVDLGLLPD